MTLDINKLRKPKSNEPGAHGHIKERRKNASNK